MKKVLCTILVLTLVFALTACSGSSGDSVSSTPADSGQAAPEEPKYVLKVGHVEATDGSYHYLCTYFADRVKERTNGQVQVEVYPQSQLGSELELAEGLRIGTIDFSVGSVGNVTPLIPEAGLLGVPYIIESLDHLDKLINPDGVFFEALSEKITSKDIGIVLLGIPTAGVRDIYNNVRPISSPEAFYDQQGNQFSGGFKGIKNQGHDFGYSNESLCRYGSVAHPSRVQRVVLGLAA